jgi:virginiamycin B lyase
MNALDLQGFPCLGRAPAHSKIGHSPLTAFSARVIGCEIAVLADIDAADGRVTDIPLPDGVRDAGYSAGRNRYRGLGIGEGAVWIADTAASMIYRVDPETNRVTLAFATEIFGSPGDVAVGAGSVWVVTFEDHDRTLTRYDAETGAVEARIAVPRPGGGVVVGHGAVWVTGARAAELYRIDPARNRLVATTPIYAGSHEIAADAAAIWIAHNPGGITDRYVVVERVDPASGKVVARIATGIEDLKSAADIATGGGFVWLITRGGAVAKIDPGPNAALGIFRPAPGTLLGHNMRWGGGSLWVSGATVTRIDPP